MSKEQLRDDGPLGLDRREWSHYAVDGDEDGHIRHADPADSAATLARLIWSRGSLRAGIFTHNQAAVVRAGGARRGRTDRRQLQGQLRRLARSPRSAAGFETPGPTRPRQRPRQRARQTRRPAVKAAIAAANSITTTPYVWGGGHGSWYSYGYDCSGAVSFALYGAGLLDTPARPRAPGELRRTGPGPLDHDLRQRHPRLRR